MPKFLIQANYTAEGVRGLLKDSASGRRAAVDGAIRAMGGSLETFYYCFGPDDAIVIVDLPDNTAAATLAINVAASGLVRIRTTPLFSVEEFDKALGGKADYRAPGA